MSSDNGQFVLWFLSYFSALLIWYLEPQERQPITELARWTHYPPVTIFLQPTLSSFRSAAVSAVSAL